MQKMKILSSHIFMQFLNQGFQKAHDCWIAKVAAKTYVCTDAVYNKFRTIFSSTTPS